MTSSKNSSQSLGVNESEQLLHQLGTRSFLSLWRYSNLYKNQGQELCDLLVVFGNHVLIFSDKYCQFKDSDNLNLDWDRWFRASVEESAKQLWGAERWIKSFPNRIFLDAACTQPFPIPLPDPNTAIFHRILVAHGASDRCKAKLGGSGSLMLDNQVVGKDHHTNKGGIPFVVGQIDPAKGYVHIFDDTTLNIVMETLDTIMDFVTYLSKKEEFLQSHQHIMVAGEEELLARYRAVLDENTERDFISPNMKSYDWISFEEGFWEHFIRSPERLAQIQADKISYAWDHLIELFTKHLKQNTQYFVTEPRHEHTEQILRFMAREARFERRMLAQALADLALNPRTTGLSARATPPLRRKNGTHYIFLILARDKAGSDEDYRLLRQHLLEIYCMMVKLHYPSAEDIVGIAMEPASAPTSSQDAMYLNAHEWTVDDQAEAEALQEEFGLLKTVNERPMHFDEYPISQATVAGADKSQKNQRNKPCPCGSGKKYKHCCMRKRPIR